MPQLAILRHDEGVRLNSDAIMALFAELGEAAAEKVIYRAADELAARLAELLRFADKNQSEAMVRSARLLAKVAEQLGMTILAEVAYDVVTSTEAGDTPAQAATIARLVRIGDRSLSAIWALRGQGA